MSNHERLQLRSWKELPLKDVPGGTHIDPKLIFELISPLNNIDWSILDLGAGNGRLGKSLGELMLRYIAVEYNVPALRTLSRNWSAVYKADLGRNEPLRNWSSVAGGVVAQGLLCNLFENQPILKAGYRLVVKGGCMFVADCCRQDQEHHLLKSSLGAEYQQHQAKWKRRYEVNANVHNTPDGVFVVGKPNSLGKDLQWGDEKDISVLVQSDGFERFSRHISMSEFSSQAAEIGFEQVLQEEKIWFTRSGHAMAGFLAVLRRTKILPGDVGNIGVNFTDYSTE